MRQGIPFAFALSIGLLLAFTTSAKAQVASDGAAGANVAYEAGTASDWYIEEQAIGVTYIKTGIDQENPATISEGLSILNWGFNREGSDGSFPGTGDGTDGEPFHSTSIFIEAAARAMLELRNYNPVTYTLSPTTYSATITKYTHDILLSAEWLTGATDSSVPVVGKQYDAPFTHRRYILAACLQESAVLTGDKALTPIADTYISAGLALQLPSGWTAALTKNANGTYPPATLVAPGKSLPTGTVESFSAAGVNPENNGYDVNYQAYGLEFAEYWMNNSPTDTLYPSVKTMLINGLTWEESQISGTGQINPNGNSRVGLETGPNGELKTISYPLVSSAFLQSVPLLGPKFESVGNRVYDQLITISATPVTSDGAASSNSNFDKGTSTSWNIGLQMSAADWITAGVAANDAVYVQEGITVLNWGMAHQSANGSFGTTSDPYFGTVQFIEAAARCTLLLKSYNATKYASNIAAYTSMIEAATGWLTGSLAKTVAQNLSHSVADEYAAAACLAESSALTGSAALLADAVPYVDAGLAMQLPSGENPESGAADPNWQGIGVQYAEFYYPYASASAQTSLRSMTASAMKWEMPYVNIDGDVNGETAIRSIEYAFADGASITGQPEFQVVANRIAND